MSSPRPSPIVSFLLPLPAESCKKWLLTPPVFTPLLATDLPELFLTVALAEILPLIVNPEAKVEESFVPAGFGEVEMPPAGWMSVRCERNTGRLANGFFAGAIASARLPIFAELSNPIIIASPFFFYPCGLVMIKFSSVSYCSS